MSLITDVKTAITAVTDPIEQGEAWLRQVVDEHLPALAGAAEKLSALEKSPLGAVVLAVLDAALGPQVEQDIADVITKFAALAGRAAAAQAAPAAAEAEAPADAAPDGAGGVIP